MSRLPERMLWMWAVGLLTLVAAAALPGERSIPSLAASMPNFSGRPRSAPQAALTPSGTGTNSAASGLLSQLPASPGWFEAPNTRLLAVCPADSPEYEFRSNCRSVIAAWNGGIADTKRNRVIIWGGGHRDYYGNEVYAFDVNSLQMLRITDPSPVNASGSGCIEALSDGKPNSRHTYSGLAYIAHADRLFSFGGSLNACGGFSTSTWTFDLATLQWSNMNPRGASPAAAPGVVASYEPNTKAVFLDDTARFWSYNYDANSYALLNGNAVISYHMNGVIDPVRRLFIMFGGGGDPHGGAEVISIAPRSSYAVQDWNARVKGCEALQNTVYPGLAFDPVRDRVVGWAGDDTVYLFDPVAKMCTPLTYPHGPGASQPTGSHGRFRYFPDFDVFVLVNDANENVYLLRLPKTLSPSYGGIAVK